eukprot:TRINITY_DN12724_c0_g3_i1.p1 TRINITY_DN12724_c0_g3~~TRINITY_DN12724_c0_g3_i1.p1  ORF type:complete len:390 (-),score=108.99 TRINITY_DN12724_c0_g3_i1:55-1224(-)
MEKEQQTQRLIKEAFHVLFVDSQENAKVSCMDPEGYFLPHRRHTKLFKKKIPHKEIIGHPFNSEFDASGELIKYIGPITAKSFKSLAEEVVSSETEFGASNKELYDTNTSQKLSSEEIAQMQSIGIVGKDLVKEILKNSATFDKKTVYSQAKYIGKKEKKYVKKVFVYSPTVYLLAKHYLNHRPEKIGFMRFDTLGLMLHMGDVRPGNTVIINETTSGLLLAAAAERMGGEGAIQYIFEDKADIEVLSELNATSKIKRIITMTNMKLVFDKPPEAPSNLLIGEILKSQEGEGHGLLIANLKYHPIDLLRALWKRLSKSGAFAIYHRYLQTLVDTEAFIKENKLAVYLHLEELWLRQYQVLKDRTRPQMKNEHSAGGYVLYGYKVNELFI